MSNKLSKAISVGSCIAMTAVTTNAIKHLANDPIDKAYYTIGSTALWLYCIKSATSILLVTI